MVLDLDKPVAVFRVLCERGHLAMSDAPEDSDLALVVGATIVTAIIIVAFVVWRYA